PQHAGVSGDTAEWIIHDRQLVSCFGSSSSRLWQAAAGCWSGRRGEGRGGTGRSASEMRDDDGPGPLTPASTSGAAICRRISGAGHQIDLLDRSNRLAPTYPRV